MEERDVEVLLQDGMLGTLRGEKKVEKDSGNWTSSASATMGASNARSPSTGTSTKARSPLTFRNGILTVTMPKSAQAIERTKRIPVNAGSRAH